MKLNLFFVKIAAGVIFLMCCFQNVFAQSYADSLAKDEDAIVTAISAYSTEIRNAILNVSKYPQAIVKIERIQSRSSQAFQDLVEQYPKQDQEKIYSASRFPELLQHLSQNKGMNKGQINYVMKDYPEEIQNQVFFLYDTHFDDLVKMNNLYQSSQMAFQKVLEDYPLSVKNDFQKVISMPDVMELLVNNIDLTMSLGENYKSNPYKVTKLLDSVSEVLSNQKSQDLARYKQDVDSNQALQNEMKKAASDYAKSTNQSDTYITNNIYDNTPYPYWYGYPFWYSYPTWYPQPLYYQTGFYFGSNGNLFVVGLPSLGFSNWFFNYGYRYYPNMYNHYRWYYNDHSGYHHYHSPHHGFNDETYKHFSTPNRGGRSNAIKNINGPRSSTRSARPNYLPQNNFNSNGYRHFESKSYHNSGWNNVNHGGGRGNFGRGGGAHWGGVRSGNTGGNAGRGGGSRGVRGR